MPRKSENLNLGQPGRLQTAGDLMTEQCRVYRRLCESKITLKTYATVIRGLRQTADVGRMSKLDELIDRLQRLENSNG